MPYYSPILPSVSVDAAPSGLIAKTKSNQSQGREATLLEVPYSCLMSRYRWEGWCLRLKTSTFEPCHIICQLGPALDNVHVNVMWRPGFGFWVGMGAMLLSMGGHGWASVLCIPAFSSKLESNFSDAGNTLTKKHSGLKPSTVNDLLFVRSNQDLV
jgi:hypothetical protein